MVISFFKWFSIRQASAKRCLVLTMVLFSLSGCNLLGINPTRRSAPMEKAVKEKTPAQPKPDQPANDEKPDQSANEELVNRIDDLEKQLQESAKAYEERLQSMDRTIALLEQTILELKHQKNASGEAGAASEPPKNGAPKSPKITQPATMKPAANTEPSLPQNQAVGEIKTPDTSKAVETVSLLDSKSADKKGKPPGKPDARRTKPPLVGMDTDSEANKQPDYQAWEDPDLKTPPSPIQLRVVPGAKRRYQEAFKVYAGRNYNESIKLFNAFLIDFPDDQDADNSQFWIGLSHFQMGNYLHAEQAFRNVLRNYPHGSTRRGYKTPDAMLMLGRIYLIRKKPIKARYYFEQVRDRYPDTRSAVKATREIEALDSF